MSTNPFSKLTKNHYHCIVADPPWRFAPMGIDPSKIADKYKSRAAEHHYDTMLLPEIKRLPVKDLCAKSSVLFLWVTSPFLQHGIEVIESWGFKYKTVAFCWVKKTKDNTRFAKGMGWYTLSNVEL
jgi:N6-adenosine-specific RNA methylase IME4